MAAQKAEAQRRLLRPSKKYDGDASDWHKRRLSVEKKKGELVGEIWNLSNDKISEWEWNKFLTGRESNVLFGLNIQNWRSTLGVLDQGPLTK